jgi:hypothetical protein
MRQSQPPQLSRDVLRTSRASCSGGSPKTFGKNMNLCIITREMCWLTRFKRLFIFSGLLFLVISIIAFAFGQPKISNFEIVLFDHPFRGISAVIVFYLFLPLAVAFLAILIASGTWAEDKFRQFISSSKK